MASGSTIKRGDSLDFMKLPRDIHMLICSLALPLSIIALRRTCKIMHYVTRQRVVWINVLQRICLEKTVYLGTYSPLSNMDLPGLEYAALAPYRWERKAQTASCRGEAVMNLSGKTTYQQSIPSGPMASSEMSFLVPGGRFFVTLHHQILELWDLGFCTQRGPDAPIATVHSECHSFTVHPFCDGQAIRILTVRYPTNSITDLRDEGYTFDVFEINQDQPAARFTKIASIQVISEYSLHYTSIYKNLLVLVHECIVKVWDFVDDGWASWATECASQQILLATGQIMLIDIGRRVTVWAIPALSPDAVNLAKGPEVQSIQDQEPLCSLYLPPEFGGWWCNGLSDWYTGSQQPLWLDVFSWPDVVPGHATIQRFQVMPHHTEGSPQTLDHLSTFSIGSYEYVLPCRVSGSDLSFVCVDSTHIRCQVGQSLRNTAGYTVSLLNLAIDRNDFMNISFCPIAGRLCHASSAGNARYIHVIDYLSPPSKSFTTN